MTSNIPIPDGWGSDSLSQFLDATSHNTLASVHQHREWYDQIAAVDREFHCLADGLDDPEYPLAAIFVMRAHSAFLAATRVGLGTQLPESYMVLRGSLEAALYGLYLAKHEDAQAVWMHRQDNDDARAACRRRFQARTLSDYLKEIDPTTYVRYQRMYEWCIDLGAHPNAWSVAGHLSIDESPAETSFVLRYLSMDLKERTVLFMHITRIGVIVLDVFSNLFRERFDRLGITERLGVIKQVL